jgi:hypothetical protein
VGEFITRRRVMADRLKVRRRRYARQVERQAYTFHLDPRLVERARREIEEGDVIRSIEAALAAAIDYQLWVREVSSGHRDVLS